MAWSDTVRRPHARATIFSDLTLGTRLLNYTDERILSIDVTEETPCIALKRRVSECTLRITNDLATNSYGVRAPSMGAMGVEDPASLVGKVLRTYIWEGSDTSEQWVSTFVIDSVEATDDGAAVHGLGVESLLDRTFDDVGLSTSLGTSDTAMTWMLDAMEACGFNRSSIRYPSGMDTSLPRAYEVEGSTPVGDVVRGIAAFKGLVVGTTDTGSRGVVVPMAGYVYAGGPSYGGPLAKAGFEEPAASETAGTLVVSDPTDGTSFEMDLLNDQDGALEVSVPFSSDLSDDGTTDPTGTPCQAMRYWCGDRLGPWARAGLTGDPYQVHANSYGTDSTWGLTGLLQPFARTTAYTNAAGNTIYKGIGAYRIEHRFDGGYRQTVSGRFV